LRRELEERVKQMDKEAARLRKELEEKTRWLNTAPEVREAFTRYDRDKNGKLGTPNPNTSPNPSRSPDPKPKPNPNFARTLLP